MKKYQNQNGMTVQAEYGKENGNPFFEALPEILGKAEVMKRLKSPVMVNEKMGKLPPEERRKKIMELSKWFYPMDYMYTIYDMLYRAMTATYQTKNVVDHIRQMNDLYTDFRTGRETISRRSIPRNHRKKHYKTILCGQARSKESGSG